VSHFLIILAQEKSYRLNLPDMMVEEDNFLYLQLARLYNPIRSVTLTSGTIESPEKTARILLPLVRRIREDTGLSVHVQRMGR